MSSGSIGATVGRKNATFASGVFLLYFGVHNGLQVKFIGIEK